MGDGGPGGSGGSMRQGTVGLSRVSGVQLPRTVFGLAVAGAVLTYQQQGKQEGRRAGTMLCLLGICYEADRTAPLALMGLAAKVHVCG